MLALVICLAIRKSIVAGRGLAARQAVCHSHSFESAFVKIHLSIVAACSVFLFVSSLQGQTSSEPARVDATQASDKNKVLLNWLASQELQPGTINVMQLVIQQHGDETTWVGKSNNTLFSIVARKVENRTAANKPVLVGIVRLNHSLAVREILTAKYLLDAFRGTGLSDATTLRSALTEAKLNLSVKGKAKLLQSNSQAVDSHVFSFVLANASDLSAYLTEAPQLKEIRVAYRAVMHRKAKRLMEEKDWGNALLLWHHLHKRKLVSPELYLDAAKCFAETGQPAQAVLILQEAYAAYQADTESSFFEQIGDLAIKINSRDGEKLAVAAYEHASSLLR